MTGNIRPKVDYKIPLRERLVELANLHKSPLYDEYKFHPSRRWRFDYAFPELMIAVEYDGIMFRSVGHMSMQKIIKDHERTNAAQLLGWTIYRTNAMHVDDGSFFEVIEQALDNAVEDA